MNGKRNTVLKTIQYNYKSHFTIQHCHPHHKSNVNQNLNSIVEVQV